MVYLELVFFFGKGFHGLFILVGLFIYIYFLYIKEDFDVTKLKNIILHNALPFSVGTILAPSSGRALRVNNKSLITLSTSKQHADKYDSDLGCYITLKKDFLE
jgi:hypothetical protein